MIRINRTPKGGKKNTYVITHNWMLGDSDGDYKTSQDVSQNNQYLDKFLECCKKLTEPLPGTWANILDTSTMKKCLKDDYKFFARFLESDWDDEDEDEDGEVKATEVEEDMDEGDIGELTFEISTERGHTFVSYQGFSIVYYDSSGIKFGCTWTPN
jgi:hypothetical protein